MVVIPGSAAKFKVVNSSFSPYVAPMGKRTHNLAKGEGSLYRSVHAGRLAANHSVAARLLQGC
jgi:hypothetical protein